MRFLGGKRFGKTKISLLGLLLLDFELMTFD